MKIKLIVTYIFISIILIVSTIISAYVFLPEKLNIDIMSYGIKLLFILLLFAVVSSYLLYKITHKNFQKTLNKIVNTIPSDKNLHINSYELNEENVIKMLEYAIREDNKKDAKLIQESNNIKQKYADLSHDCRETLEKKKELEEENSAKIKFIASISNELRNPINGIVGMLEILLSTDIDEKQKKYLLKLRESSDMLISIVNDVLDITELENNKVKIEYSEFELKRLIEDVIYEFKEKANQKGLEYVYKISPELPGWVIADKNKLKKIFNNFMSNAIKFTNYGTIFIDVRIKEKKDEEVEIEFIIEDTGIGIEKEKLKKKYIPFANSKFDFNRKYSGIGMGIVISKRLLEIVNGSLKIDSTPSDGTKIIFQMKFKEIIKHFKKITDMELKFENMKCILAGEDENNTYMNILESAGVKVLRLKNLQDVADVIVDKDDYNFIVYDTTKDYIENFESLKNIFEINKGEKLIMFLSNHNEIREMVNTIDLYSSTEFILKPIGKDEFINNIKYAINKKAANEMETDLKEMQSNLIENQTIMLVEDNDVNRIALKTILEKRGYNVIVAENGAVALKLFTLNTINIILMDIQMPVMDGYEATKKIRELEKMSKSKVPILGVTAYTSDENKKKYFQSGMDDYIAKPIRVDDLYIVLDKYL